MIKRARIVQTIDVEYDSDHDAHDDFVEALYEKGICEDNRLGWSGRIMKTSYTTQRVDERTGEPVGAVELYPVTSHA